jgi:hypothetical protein
LGGDYNNGSKFLSANEDDMASSPNLKNMCRREASPIGRSNWCRRECDLLNLKGVFLAKGCVTIFDLREAILDDILGHDHVRKASNVRAFEKHLVLLDRVMDIVFNIQFVHKNGGKGNGKWYHASTIKLFEILQNFGGSLMHNFISKNLVGPALNTTRSNFIKKVLYIL